MLYKVCDCCGDILGEDGLQAFAVLKTDGMSPDEVRAKTAALKQWWIGLKTLQEVDEIVDNMIRAGVLEVSDVAWSEDVCLSSMFPGMVVTTVAAH